MRRMLLAVGVAALCPTWAAPTHGAVLCQKRSGAVFVRNTCKKKETALTLAQFGAVGPKGDAGPQGNPGPKGDKGDPGGLSVPCATQVGTDVFFTGCNVNVRSGSGSTDGTVNGLGNLIVGYNKGTLGQTRTGSHNVVVGDEHAYTSYSGLVAGHLNTISGPSASVSGGGQNTASGNSSSVSGGFNNTASGASSSVSGGQANTASGGVASASGGLRIARARRQIGRTTRQMEAGGSLRSADTCETGATPATSCRPNARIHRAHATGP